MLSLRSFLSPTLAWCALLALAPCAAQTAYGDGHIGQHYFGAGYRVVATADIDGDGRVELVATSGSHVALYRVTGATYELICDPWMAPIGLSLYSYRTSAVGDFDADGSEDILVLSEDVWSSPRRWRAFLLEYRDGALRDESARILSYELSSQVQPPSVGDIDGDGDLDVLLSGPGGVGVWLNVGGRLIPGYGRGHTRWLYGAGISMGDVDGDGDLDAAVGDHMLLRNNGLGFFSAEELPFPPRSPLNTDASDAVLADFDGDGDLDLFVVPGRYASNENGTFVDRSDLVPRVGAPGDRAYADDLDGDGDRDLIVASWNSAPLTLLRAHDGSFAPAPSSMVSSGSIVVQLEDLDGDGDLDWIGSDSFTRNDGGTFRESCYGGVPIWIASQGILIDANSDGRVDALFTSNWNPRIALNDGLGRFGDCLPIWRSLAPFGPRAVLDIDGDGDEDLVAQALLPTGHFEPQPMVAINDGHGGFTDEGASRFPLLPGVREFEFVDLDGDGDLDCIASKRTDAEVCENTGGGFFVWRSTFAGDARTAGYVDLDFDGDLDLVLSGSSVRENRGMAFVPNPWIHLPGVVSGASIRAVLDANGDGLDDIAALSTSSASGGESLLFLSTGTGWAPPRPIPGLVTNGPVGTGDIDLDGDEDILADGFYLNDGAGQFPDRVSYQAAWLMELGRDLDGDGDRDDLIYRSRERGLELIDPASAGGTMSLGCYHRAGYNPRPTVMGVFVAGDAAAPAGAAASAFGTWALDPNAVLMAIADLPARVGGTTLDVSVPAHPSVLGVEFALQGVIVGDRGLEFTNVVVAVVTVP